MNARKIPTSLLLKSDPSAEFDPYETPSAHFISHFFHWGSGFRGLGLLSLHLSLYIPVDSYSRNRKLPQTLNP